MKPDWLESLLPIVPFSLVGAMFGDSIRKDALTGRQRVAAALFSFAMGPVAAMIVTRDLHFSEAMGWGAAAFAPTIAYDITGLAVTFIRYLRDNPGALKDLWPWGRR